MDSLVDKKPRHSTLKEFALFMAIPVSIMLITIGVLVVPSLFAHPSYDFVYSSCSAYECANSFQVSSRGVITESSTRRNFDTAYGSDYQSPVAELYYYSVSKRSSQRIDVAAANQYKFDTSNVSPDGYLLKQSDGSDGGFLFWGSSYDTNWYLMNGSKKKAVNLVQQNKYSSTVSLLGWVKQ